MTPGLRLLKEEGTLGDFLARDSYNFRFNPEIHPVLRQRKILVGLVTMTAITMLAVYGYAEEPTSQTNAHLKKWLEKYPEADLNGDGVLTASEVWLFQADKPKKQQAKQAQAKRARQGQQSKQASQASKGQRAAKKL
jgi:hypothetical protein